MWPGMFVNDVFNNTNRFLNDMWPNSVSPRVSWCIFMRKLQYFLFFQSLLKVPRALYGDILYPESWKKSWKSPDSCVSGWVPVDICRYQVFCLTPTQLRDMSFWNPMPFFFQKKDGGLQMLISPSWVGVRQKTGYLKISTHPETHESGDFQHFFQDYGYKILT